MPRIDLKYGRSVIVFDHDAGRFDVLGEREPMPALTDAALGERLDNPIGSPAIEEIVGPGQTVLIVVPDATRQTGCGQIVNLVVRRLIANGTLPFDIRIIFATGIHRKVTDEERAAILTPFIAQRVKTLDHDPRDLMQLVQLGETSGGIPIELNRALVGHDHVIIIGGITFHYFAGFTGGRKLICPGLAGARTVAETHKLAFDTTTGTRRQGVDTATLDGNAVNEAFMEVVSRVEPAFCISSIVGDSGEVTGLYCGNWISSHRAGCDAYAAGHTVRLPEKRDLVVVSCGGYPHDINLIQAHKALEAASHACREGGTIVFVAECADGLGRDDLLKWFEYGSSHALADVLCEKYQVNGQTAWSLLTKAEKYDIRMISSLPAEVIVKMGMRKAATLEDACSGNHSSGYLVAKGASVLIEQLEGANARKPS